MLMDNPEEKSSISKLTHTLKNLNAVFSQAEQTIHMTVIVVGVIFLLAVLAVYLCQTIK